MEKYQLEQYVAVVEAGSISQAAKILYLAQPNLSKTMQNLEKELGYKLLKRSRQGIETTPSGKELYYHAKNILERFQQLEDWKTNVQALPSYLNISISSLFIDLRILSVFYQKIKSHEIYIDVHETDSLGVLEDIASGKSEIGIVVLNDTMLKLLKKLADSHDIVIHSLARDYCCLHVRNYLSVSNIALSSFQIRKDMIWIQLPTDFFEYINAPLSEYHFIFKSDQKKMICNHFEQIIHLLNTLDSFLIGNIWQKERLEQSHIKTVPLLQIPVQQNFLILYKKKQTLSKAALNYIQSIKEIYHFD